MKLQNSVMTLPITWPLPKSDEAPARALLARICAKAELHARFLNTLSLLEHIGSRKILLSQARSPESHLAGDTLKHLAEETRHAFFFKRAAEAIAGRPLSYAAAETMAASHARFYMGRLDGFIARTAQGAGAYLCMSLIIELRAIWFYKIYKSALRECGHPLKLSSILAEESRHLSEMNDRLTIEDEALLVRVPAFVAFEEARFATFLDALAGAAAAA